ncbi:MAG: PIG-L family deacetylase [Actinomycetes bacterium]
MIISVLLGVTLFVLTACVSRSGQQTPTGSTARPTVLFITAHPDDETMFGLSRFVERGWTVDIALVTNGESGQVVEAIRTKPKADGDSLFERLPGPRTAVVTTPPDGVPGRSVLTPTDLATVRQSEFLDSMGRQGVSRVYLLSGPTSPAFEDSWDNGVRNWDVSRLRVQLLRIDEQVDPDVIITLNPGETWAHPQHQGLGKIVTAMWNAGELTSPDATRPALYGIREIGWYQQSVVPQTGDEQFDRTIFSPVLGRTYADYWSWVTSSYVSQGSHPVWFAARVGTGFLPGYKQVDVIRRLVDVPPDQTLTALFAKYPPDASLATKPGLPQVIRVWEVTPASG